MKSLIVALAIVTAAICSTSINAQTYKQDWATKVTLAGSGTNIANTITLSAATPGTAFTYLLPDGPVTSGFVLKATTIAGGVSTMTWVDPTIAANAWNLGGNTAPGSTILGNNSALGVLDIRSNNATTLYLTGANKVGVGGTTTPAGQFANTSNNNLYSAFGSNNQTFNWEGNSVGWLAEFTNTGATASSNGVAIGVGNTDPATTLLSLQAPSNIIFNVTADGKVVTSAGSSLTVGNLATAGVVHNAAGGLLSTGLVTNVELSNSTIGLSSSGSLTVTGSPISLGGAGTVNLNLANANTWTATQTFPAGSLTNTELANSTIALSSSGSLTVTGSPISLGGAGTVNLNLANANNWTGTQTITGAGKFVYVDGNQTAGNILTENGSGVASWVSPSTLAIVSTATGTAPITVNGDNAAHSGAITIAVTTGALTSTGSTMTVTGTGNTVGANINADLNLAHANTWTATQTFPAGSLTNAELANSTIALSSSGSLTVTGSPISLGGAGTVNLNLANANTWTATQTFPAGSLTNTELANSTIALSSSGSLTVTGSPISLGGAGTVNLNLANANTWTGAQTFSTATTTISGPLAYTNGTPAAGKVLTSDATGNASWQNSGATVTYSPSTTNNFAGNTNNFAINGSNTIYYLQNTSGGNVNLTGIAAAVPGRLIVLVNNSTGAANSITLTDKDILSTDVNQFHLQGAANIILGIDGTATLVYDAAASNTTGTTGAWRVISNY